MRTTILPIMMLLTLAAGVLAFDCAEAGRFGIFAIQTSKSPLTSGQVREAYFARAMR
jgi:hypothetical protein